MARYTVDLSAAAESRLQLLVAQYNVATGAVLTLTEWIALHLKELAIQREAAVSAEGIQTQGQADVDAALRADRARLLTDLG